MVKKSSKNLSKNNQVKKTSIWKKLSYGLVLIVALIGAILLLPKPKDDAIATFSISKITPQQTQFADSATVSYSIGSNLPDINNNRVITNIEPAIVYYNWQEGDFVPVFKVNLTAQELNQAVQIKPFIKGNWQQRGASLVFIPEQDWPADKKFTVKINKDIFNPEVKVDSRKISFETEKLLANIESFDAYPSTDAKKNVVSIAVISFNYPIDTKDFAKQVSLQLDGKDLKFDVKFDKYQRTAFITSGNIAITDEPQTIKLKLDKIPALYGTAKTEKITGELTVESLDNIFKIAELTSTVADDTEGNPQQLILLNLTEKASSKTNWSNKVNAYLLPKSKDNSNNVHTWSDDEITKDVLKKSTKVSLNNVAFENPNGVFQYAFAYDISQDTPRYLYVTVEPEIESAGGLVSKNGLNKVLPVAYPNPEIKIAGTGSLLSLGGDKKLGLVAKGDVRNAYVNLFKVKANEVNHLISQTYNLFGDALTFKSWSFDESNISNVFQKRISFANVAKNKANYASINLGEYLDKTPSDKTGIFVIQVSPNSNQDTYADKKVILLTDLGIIRKINSDRTSSVFISYLSNGQPAGEVSVSVIGKNGNAIWQGKTNATGRINLPDFPTNEYRNAKEPVAIIATKNDDISFIPYNAMAQQVEYSKFNVDGVYSSSYINMNAFVFTDRGIYRPSESVIIGSIVKNKDFTSVSGTPVKVEIRDSKGRINLEKTISLKSNGMFDIVFDLSNTAPLGEYQVNVFSLNERNNPEYLLGNTSFKVEEFVPDNMKINAKILNINEKGWTNPNGLQAKVSLHNLFGTPATDKRITATAILTPTDFNFSDYSDYKFTENFISGTGLADNTVSQIQTLRQEFDNIKTDNEGNAIIDIKFDKTIPWGNYKLTLNVKGYEGDSGKNVQTSISTRISDAQYLVGYKANTNLNYINRSAKQTVNFIAINPQAQKTTAKDLSIRLIKKENLTSLVKDYSGYYKYQTITKEKLVSKQEFVISEKGTDFALNTSESGQYYLQVVDADNKVLSNLEYFVAGSENTDLKTDTNAELKVKLNAKEYKPGEEIIINITSPFAGSGLITIERDKVYAYKWFKTDSTTSEQRIKLPENFEGTGYVNISFVRDINSRDIFTSPYSYAVAEFSADTSKRKVSVKLDVPEKVKNNKLTVKYSTNKPADIMIFAINTGILQVARYQVPNPMAYFFKKSALQVETYQILSLLLPEYNILKEYAKTGGGDYADFGSALNQILTNPFAKKTLPPIAFYSGILSSKADKTQQITFDIPDYFNGSIKVFAVATDSSAIGSNSTETVVQSPIIITTTNPVAVAPEDTFEINATISNLTENSGEKAKANIKVSLTTETDSAISGKENQEINIPQDSEKLVKYDVKTGKELGNVDIDIVAEIENEAGKKLSARRASNSYSVRPATTFTTNVRADIISSKETTIKNYAIEMFPEYRTQKLYISDNMALLSKPLVDFLGKYEYPCSEQLVSKTIPYVLLNGNKLLGTSFQESNNAINATINELKNRQNADGSFALWSSSNDRNHEFDSDTAYLTAYVADFLSLAKEKGFSISENMQSRSIDFLRSYAGNPIKDADELSAKAFAIYVITKNGFVTTNYIDSFEEYANANVKDWSETISGAYIATAYKLLKQDDKAEKLLNNYKESKEYDFEYSSTFDNNIANDAIYGYLRQKFFGYQGISNIDLLLSYINGGNYGSFTSAMIIKDFAATETKEGKPLDITVKADGKVLTKSAKADYYNVPSSKKLEISCSNCSGAYYTFIQQGYPVKSQEESNGIEVIREYYNENGERINTATVGDTVEVKIYIRTKGSTDYIDNAVITDLLPGGFVADNETYIGDTEFQEFREDRNLFFTSVSRTEKTISYKAQATTVGTFTIPAIHAESMDNPQLTSTGKAGTFTVKNAK